MLLFGEELRLPTEIDAKVETWHDQSTELYKLFERRRLVEAVIKEKKLEAFEDSQKKLEDRFKEINWEVGQQVFCYVDRRTVGQSSKGLVRWSGPFEILEVRQSTVVISRNGKKATINQTMCTSVKGLMIPSRDLRGRPVVREPADQKKQDEITKRKLTELTQKLRAVRRRPPSEEPLDDPEDTLEDKPCPEEGSRLTLARIRPVTKYNYKPEDLKSDTVAVVFVFEATRLARYISSRQVEIPPV